MTDDKDRNKDEETKIQFMLLDTDFATKHPDAVQALSKHQLVYSIAGLVLGLVCVFSGSALLKWRSWID